MVFGQICGHEIEENREGDPISEGIPPLRRHGGHGPEGGLSSHLGGCQGRRRRRGALSPSLPMAAEGREPLRGWISLSVLFCFVFPKSGRKPFLIFQEIRNSGCAEILTCAFLNISFLAPEVELQPTFEEGTTHHHVPGAWGAPWCIVPCVGLRLR